MISDAYHFTSAKPNVGVSVHIKGTYPARLKTFLDIKNSKWKNFSLTQRPMRFHSVIFCDNQMITEHVKYKITNPCSEKILIYCSRKNRYSPKGFGNGMMHDVRQRRPIFHSSNVLTAYKALPSGGPSVSTTVKGAFIRSTFPLCQA